MDSKQQQLWRAMLGRSWQPRQWFIDEDVGSDYEGFCDKEAKTMWVYKRGEAGLWTVGYFSPDREWHPESDHPTKDQAAARVRWLNGGNN